MNSVDCPNRTLEQGIRANAEHNFIYLNNPKAACGSVKLNFWANITGTPPRQVLRNLHNVHKSPFCNRVSELDWAENACVFTIVRNPFTRIVSAYMDKIAQPGKRVRRDFDARYGIKDTRHVPFGEFVDLICDDIPAQLDHHWRPQHINVLENLVQPNFVGTLETIGRDLPMVLGHVLGQGTKPVEASQRHKTNASSSYLDVLSGAETVRKLCSLYARDFEVYGYTPEGTAPIQSANSAAWTSARHPKLVELARARHVTKGANIWKRLASA